MNFEWCKYWLPKIFSDKRVKKFIWQKITRGFSDDETWSLEYGSAKWILPRLRRFKELNNSHPMDLTFEKWMEIIDKMIYAFETIIARDDPDKDINWDLDIDKKVKEGLELFGKYFLDLWW